jgi:hypothetical protein
VKGQLFKGAEAKYSINCSIDNYFWYLRRHIENTIGDMLCMWSAHMINYCSNYQI